MWVKDYLKMVTQGASAWQCNSKLAVEVPADALNQALGILLMAWYLTLPEFVVNALSCSGRV